MKVLVTRIWREPAVFIGLVASLGLLIVNLLADTDIDAATGLAIAGPLISALGIRQAVSPAAGPRRDPEP